LAFEEPLDGDALYADLLPTFEPTPVRPAPEDLYCLLYTSGTTGQPKGVMIPQRMVAWNGVNTVVSWQLQASDVAPIFTPLYHAGGLMVFLVPIVTVGGTIVLHRTFDAAEVWRAVERWGCTVILGVPTIWKLLLEAPEFAVTDLSRVRWGISGGAPLPEYLIEAYHRRGLVLKQGFGMTEVGVNCFAMSPEEALRKRGSIGKPLMFTEVRLVDATGQATPAGEVGELCFRGPHVCQGYWQRPDATAAAFDAAGFFKSGDLARVDEDGFFWIAGRAKEMFISGGVNVYPAEIENALLAHPGLAEAAVVGIADPDWGEVGLAFVVEQVEGAAREDELLSFLAERLARFKLPKRIVKVDVLPRTASGKVQKGELIRGYLWA
jgi:fatty-acyl-CoA synthase